MPNNNVVLISRDVADHEAVRSALQGSFLRLVSIVSLSDRMPPVEDAGIILWDAEFRAESWKTMLAWLKTMPHRPRFVLLTSVPNTTLWAEAINVGADDVLAKPLAPAEIRHVISCGELRKPPAHVVTRRSRRMPAYA